MATVGSITPPVTDYAEIARRPLEPEKCALIVVDIQEKLLPPIFQKEQLVKNSQLLIRLAGILDIPTMLTTQYSKGLGNTIPEVASLLPDTQAIEKSAFSCFGSDVFCSDVKALAGKPQHRCPLRHGKPYLRGTDGSGGAARGVPGACGFGRGQLTVRMELENWSGSHAGGRGRRLLDRNDYLRGLAIIRNLSI